MTVPRITVHTLVRNESRWIWFALMSIINYVDEIMVWDTGSTDDTVAIIKSISDPKLHFQEVGEVTPESFTLMHNRMLRQTHTDWMLILDGDEIWPFPVISSLVTAIRSQGGNFDFFVCHHYDLLGDVYHYQEETGGQYQIGEYSGQFSIRAVNLARLPGLHFCKPHGQIGLFTADGPLLQDLPTAAYKLLPGSYFHATHLVRSSSLNLDLQVIKRSSKYKYELGLAFPQDFSYTEVFYLPRPRLVPSPWVRRSFGYTLNALWQTPLKIAKRRLLATPKSGY